MKQETVSIGNIEDTIPLGLIPFVQAQQLNRLMRGETTRYIPICRR